VSVTPHHSHCIVALGHHVRRMYILRHLINLQNLPTIHFINAPGTPTSQPQLIRGYLFGHVARVGHMYQTFFWVVVNLGFRPALVQCRYFINHVVGHLVIYLNQLCLLGKCKDEGSPGVAHLSDLLNDRDFKRTLDPETVSQLLGVAIAKYFMFVLTTCALIVGHVFNHCDCGNLQLIEHLYTLYHIHICQFLGRCDYHSCCYLNLLPKSQLDVASSWREIYNKIV
jgi:hypothetical protein